ncbi:hypothetical protein GWO13_01730 [Candidatus Bathyarchaeota archaeon]|nr:hypothetical protein [Candidatus Bathyarchaeota archaeon]
MDTIHTTNQSSEEISYEPINEEYERLKVFVELGFIPLDQLSLLRNELDKSRLERV